MTRSASDAQYNALSKIVDKNYRALKGEIEEIQSQIGKVINLEEPLKKLGKKISSQVKKFSEEIKSIEEIRENTNSVVEISEKHQKILDSHMEIIENNKKSCDDNTNQLEERLQTQITKNLDKEKEDFESLSGLIVQTEENIKNMILIKVEEAQNNGKNYVDEKVSVLLERIGKIEQFQAQLNENITNIGVELTEEKAETHKMDETIKKVSKTLEEKIAQDEEINSNYTEWRSSIDDKVADLQQQITENLEVHNNDKSSLDKDIAGIYERITNIENHYQETDSQFAEFKETTENNITANSKSIKKAKSSISKCKQKNEEQDQRLTENEDAIAALKETQETFIQSSDIKINGVLSSQENANNAISDFQKVIDAFKERVSNEMKEKDEEFEKLSNESKNNITEVNRKLEEQKNEITALVTSEITEKDTEFKKAVSETNERIDTLNESISKISQESILDITGTIQTMREDVDKLEKKVSDNKSEAKKRIKKSQSNLVTEINNKEASLTAMIESKRNESNEQIIAEISTLKALIDENKNEIDEKTVGIEATLSTETEKIQGKIEDVNERCNKVDDSINEIQGKFDEINGKIDEKQASNESKMEKLNKEIKKGRKHCDNNKEDLVKSDDDIKKAIDDLQKKEDDDVNKVNAFINEIKELIFDVIPKEKLVEEELNSTKESIANIEEKVNKRIDEIKDEVMKSNDVNGKELIEKVSVIEGTLSSIVGDSKIDLPKLHNTVKELIDAQNRDREKSSRDTEEIRLSISNLTEKGDLLKNQIDETKGDVTRYKEQSLSEISKQKDLLTTAINDKDKAQQTRIEEVSDKITSFIGSETRNLPEIVEAIDNTNKEFKDRINNQRNYISKEIKTLKEGFEAFKVEVDENETVKATENEETLNQFRGTIGEIRSYVDELEEARKQRETDTQKQISQIYEKSLNPLSESFSTLEKRTLNLEASKDRMKDSTKRKIERVLTEVNEKIAALQETNEKNFSTIVSECSNNSESINKLDDRIKDLDEQNRLALRQLSDETTERVTELTSKITTNHKDNVKFKDEFDSRIKALEGKIDDVIGSATQNTEDAIEAMKTEVNSAINKSNSANEQITIDVTERISQFAEQISEINREVDELKEDIQKSDKDNEAKIKSAMKELISRQKDLKTSFNKKLAERYNDLLQKDSDNINKMEAYTAEAIAPLDEKINDLTAQLSSISSPDGVSIGQLASTITILTNKVDEQVSNASELEKNVKEYIRNKISAVDKRAIEAEKALTNKFSEHEQQAAKANEDIKNAHEALESTMNEKIEDIQKQIKEESSAITEKIYENNNQFTNSVKEVETNLNKKISEATSGLENSSNQIKAFKKDISDSLLQNEAVTKNLIDSKEKAIRETIEKRQEQNVNKLAQLDSDIKSISDSLTEQVKDVKEQMDGLKKDANKAVEKAEEKAGKALDVAKSLTDEVKAESEYKINMVTNSIDTLKKAVENNTAVEKSENESIKQEMTQIKQKIDNSIGKLGSQLESKITNITVELTKKDNELMNEIAASNKTFEESFSALKEQEEEHNNITNKAIQQLQDNENTEDKELKKKFADINKKMAAQKGEMERLGIICNENKKMCTNVSETSEKVKEETEKAIKELTTDFNTFRESSNNAINENRTESNSLKIKLQTLTEEYQNRMQASEENITNINKSETQINATVNAVEKELKSLQRIKIYTKEFEVFRNKFDETLSSLSDFKDNVTEFVIPQMQGITCTEGDKSFKKAASHAFSVAKEEIPEQKGKQETVEVKEGDELGKIIREHLSTSSKLVIHIPAKTRVLWNKRVIIKPFQTVKIEGEGNKSVIQMNEGSAIDKLFDPSRAVLDSLSTLMITTARIEANISSEMESSPGRGAIFVANSVSSQGPIVINVTTCNVLSTYPLVNAGCNAFLSVSVDGTRIENLDPDSRNISPVIAESGGFGEGWAVISSQETKLRGKGIDWSDNKRILTEK